MARTGSTRLGSTPSKPGAPTRSAKPSGATRFRRRSKGSKPAGSGRTAQLLQAYRLTKEVDPKIGLILLATFLFAAAVAYALLFLIPPGWVVVDVMLAVMIGVLAALIVFTRRATAAQYKQIEGKPGAALAALSVLKRGWHTDQAIAFTRNQDVVHRVVGPAGIVLVGEGNPNRLKSLLGNERRKHERVASETPIYEVVSGDGQGAVPVPKLARHVTKLGRNIKPAQM